MKKSDLKQNMIVETRGGDKYLVLENVDTLLYGGRLFFMSNDGFLSDDVYSEGLSGGDTLSEFDIVKVMKWKEFKGLKCLNKDKADSFEILWERPEPIKWQPWELEVLKHIPSYFNEITRIGNGDIRIRNDLSGIAHTLKLNLPSLPSAKNNEPLWFNIDAELARNGMKR